MWAASLVVGWVAADPWGFSPFGPIKHMVVSVGSLLFVAAVISEGDPRRVQNRRLLGLIAAGAAGLLLVVLAVAAAGGEDPWHAWVGTPDRRFGWFTWALFVAVFFGGAASRSAPVLLPTLVRSIAVAGLLLGLGAVVETFSGPLFGSSIGADRLGSLFGQPAYLGAACVLAVPISTALASDSGELRVWRMIGAAGALLTLYALLGSQTRGAYVGLAVAALATAPSWVRWVWARPWVGLVGGFAVCLILILTPVGSRALSSFDLDQGTAKGRLDEWRTAAAAMAERPVLGAGPEGYRVIFGSVVDAEYEQNYGRSVTPDRAHNGILDLVVAGGIPAAMVYVVLMSSVLVAGFHLRHESVVWTGVFGALAGFFAQQFFLFPLIEVDAVFWLLAGLSVAGASTVKRPRPPAKTPEGLSPASPWPVAVGAIALCVLAVGVMEVVADHRLARAVEIANGAGPNAGADAASVAKSAAEVRPDNIRYRFAASSLAASAGDLPGARIQNRQGLKWSPKDPNLRFQEAVLAPPGDSVVTWLALAVEDPNNAAVQLNLGRALLAEGRIHASEEVWLRASELAPTDPTPLLLLAALYDQTNRPQDAKNALDSAAKRDNLGS